MPAKKAKPAPGYDLTIPAGETESDEIDISASEVSVTSEEGLRLGPSGYRVMESGIGKCRVKLAQPSTSAATFRVVHSNTEPNSETGATTEEVHKTPMTLGVD